MLKHWLPLGLILAMLSTPGRADTAALRQEIETLKQAYSARIAALEARLAQVESTSELARDTATAASEAAAAPPASGGNSAATFNPAISLILDGKYASYRHDADSYALPGFQLGGETGLPREGFGIGESELIASANIDPYLYGELTVGLHQDEAGTEVNVEEAFFDTLALPYGLTLRGGRFFSGIGYQNAKHPHAWDFADPALAQRAFLGDNFGDDGLQLRWLAPTPFLLDLGGEVLRGDIFPAAGAGGSGSGVRSAFVHIGGDLGVSHSWRVGASRLWADANERAGGSHAHGNALAHVATFSGDSDLSLLDFVWKWAPDGNASQRSASFVAEFFDRDETGSLTLDEDGMLETTTYRGDQRGGYAQGVLQFRPRWRLGVRYDRLWANNQGDEVLMEEAGLTDDHDPSRWSAMLDFSPSEFSRFRVQYNRDHSRPQVDDQLFLQYVLSLGSHGAHGF